MTGRFFDGAQAGAHDAVLHIAADTLLVRATDGAELARWPLVQVETRDAPDPDGNTVLACQGSPARLIVGADVIDALVQAGIRVRPAHAWSARDWTIAAIVALAAIGLAVAVFGGGPRLVGRLLPASWDARLGNAIAARMEQQHRVCRGADGQRALETLVARLREAGGITRPVHIEVLDSPSVNALTLPGGHVMVLRGLISTAQDGGELAGVIAHELGHVAHHDPITMLVRQMGIGLLAGSLGSNDSLANAGGIAQQLVTLSYSRRAEAAADAAGQSFLQHAGLRADGLGRFFARLETSEPHAGGIAWFATHPPTAERRAHATRSTAGAPPLSDAEWQAVRHMCD